MVRDCFGGRRIATSVYVWLLELAELKMKKITANYFKKHCLAIVNDVQKKRKTVVITKHGKPVAKLVPVKAAPDEIFGFLAGKGEVVGDIVSPLPPEAWGNLAWVDTDNQ